MAYLLADSAGNEGWHRRRVLAAASSTIEINLGYFVLS
jgi:hypothetical protein